MNEGGYQIEGQTDTWKVIDEKNVQEQRFVQLVCEQTKKQIPDIVLHDSGVLVAQTIYGFDSSVMDILSAGQCAVRNGSAFIPDEAVAGDGSTSNADRRICDFYDSAGGWQRGCVFGTGGSNDSASMVHIRRGET